MESDKDHIKNIFSSKFKNFEPDLPNLTWETISADLPVFLENRRVLVRQKLYQVVVWTAGVAAVFLAVYFLLPQSQDEGLGKCLIAQTENRFELKRLDSKEDECNQALPAPIYTPNLLSQVTPTIARVIVNSIEEEDFSKTPNEKSESTETVSSKEVFIADNADEIDDVKNSDFEKELNERIAAFAAEGESVNNMLALNVSDRNPSQSKGFQVGLEGGSGFSKSNEAKNKINPMNYDNPNMVVLKSRKVKLEHNQPISFGVGVNKRINDKISIETGITYAYLSSQIVAEDPSDVEQKDMQYLHYFGIPLTINYTFAEWNKFRFYSSLGGMIQKDLSGTIKSYMWVDGLMDSGQIDRKKISQKNPQFSTTATLGASYPIYDKLRAYTNFGGAYYFYARNEYETIYSDKKWLFNLNLGLKFEF